MPLSAADIEFVRAVHDAFNERFEQLRTEEGMQRFHADYFTPDCVIDNVEAFPVPTSYTGLDGYRDWFADTLAPYEGIHWDIISIEPIGERAYMEAFIRGYQPGDPTLIEVRLAINYAVQNGRISRIDVYLNAATAMAAARSTA